MTKPAPLLSIEETHTLVHALSGLFQDVCDRQDIETTALFAGDQVDEVLLAEAAQVLRTAGINARLLRRDVAIGMIGAGAYDQGYDEHLGIYSLRIGRQETGLTGATQKRQIVEDAMRRLAAGFGIRGRIGKAQDVSEEIPMLRQEYVSRRLQEPLLGLLAQIQAQRLDANTAPAQASRRSVRM